MQRISKFALCAVVAFACIAHASAQTAANITSTNANVTATAAPAEAEPAFLAANITSPDALVQRIETGYLPADNVTGQLTCQFTLVGAGLSTPVDVTSLDPSTQATGLTSAVITCTGSTANATIQGGPALASFTSNFTGSCQSCTSPYAASLHNAL